jgi:hypothetical protein
MKASSISVNEAAPAVAAALTVAATCSAFAAGSSVRCRSRSKRSASQRRSAWGRSWSLPIPGAISSMRLRVHHLDLTRGFMEADGNLYSIDLVMGAVMSR